MLQSKEHFIESVGIGCSYIKYKDLSVPCQFTQRHKLRTGTIHSSYNMAFRFESDRDLPCSILRANAASIYNSILF